MSIFENMIYGFISGLTEFLPVSSRAHQILLRYMFGVDSRNFLQEFLVHIGILIAILFSCRDFLSRLRLEQKHVSASRRRGQRALDRKSYYDIRLLKTAAFPLVIGLFLSFVTVKSENNLIAVMACLLINALVLFLAEHTQHGNRDSRTMTGLDGIIMGVLGSLSVFPGISRTGMISAYTAMRGADFKHVTNWVFVLGIPAMIFFILFDVFGFFTVGAGVISLAVFAGYLLAGAFAFAGCYVSISVFLTLLNHAGFAQFAYYSVGAALFTFLLYLIT